MSERKYSVAEIDVMRAALYRRETAKVRAPGCNARFANGLVQAPSDAEYAAANEAWRAAERRAEDHLRTYMLAGVDPAEIVA